MLFGKRERVREHHRQAGADCPEQQRTHEVHDRLDLVLDVRLAQSVNEEPRNDEPLQADGYSDQQYNASTELRMNERGQDSQQYSLERNRVDNAANPAHPQGDEVERQG